MEKLLVMITLANFAMFAGASYMYLNEQPVPETVTLTDESMCLEVETVEIESAAPTHYVLPSRNRLMCER